MKTSTIKTNAMPNAPMGKAWDEVSASFDRFCLAAGIETLGAMMEADAEAACGPRHSRSVDRLGHRWGRTAGKIGFHAGKVAMELAKLRFLLVGRLWTFQGTPSLWSWAPADLRQQRQKYEPDHGEVFGRRTQRAARAPCDEPDSCVGLRIRRLPDRRH